MHLSTLALSHAMQPVSVKSSSRTFKVVTCFGISTLLGWPFAAALAIPFLFEELCLVGADVLPDTIVTRFKWRFTRLFKLSLWPAVILVSVSLTNIPSQTVLTPRLQISAVIAIDSFFYGRFVFVPFNIIAYNVFSDSATLYGTESMSYYLINLCLNFNIAFLMAIVSIPMLIITRCTNPWFFNSTSHSTKAAHSSFTLMLVRLAPFYLWLLILLPQPHKEERFMFPIYPLICFNAATSLNIARQWLEKTYFFITNSHERVSFHVLYRDQILKGHCRP